MIEGKHGLVEDMLGHPEVGKGNSSAEQQQPEDTWPDADTVTTKNCPGWQNNSITSKTYG